MSKGFTLIELLAVIVILAIIALIATPIVLNIINDTKKSSDLRTAEFYLHAVEHTIADAVLNRGGLANGNYPITNDGNLCVVPLEEGICSEEDTLIVEVNGNIPKSGYIQILNGVIANVSIELNDNTIIKNEKGELVEQVLITSIDVSYDGCDAIGVNGTCVPTVTIKPENATNKNLEFIMAETCGDKCSMSPHVKPTSTYLSINQTTGVLQKISLYPTNWPVAYVDITVKTKDGSNITITKSVKFSISNSSCWV